MDTDDETPTTEQPAPAAQPAPPDTPTLMRSSDDRLIAGVCGGLAERYGVDVGFVRILAVILALIGGVTIFAYLAAVLLLPQNDGQGNPVERVRYRRVAQLTGFAAIGVAVLMLLGNGIGVDTAIFWPSFGGAVACLAVIAFAVAVGRRLRTPAPGKRAAPPAGRVLGIVALVLAAGVGTLILIGLSAIVTVFVGATPAAIVVLAIGVMMVALSTTRRSALWLAVPALAIAAPATMLAAVDLRVDHTVGERRYVVKDPADLKPIYELGVGDMVIDLRQLSFPDKPVELRIKLGIGSARVLLPLSACVQSNSSIRLGEERILGETRSGSSLQGQVGDTTLAGGDLIHIKADIQVGQLDVSHGSWEEYKALGFGDDPEEWNRGVGISRGAALAGCAGTVAR